MVESSDNQGFMKKLLYPGFADAGSNETFQRHSPRNISDDTISEATTALHDNRNFPLHQPQRLAHHHPPPFFASTRPAPAIKNTITQQPQHNAAPLHGKVIDDSPPSPPKVDRHPFPAQRSLSTVALARGVSASDGDLPDDRSSSSFFRESLPTTDGTEKQSPVEKNESDHAEEEELPIGMTGPNYEEPNWEEEATPAQTAFGKELLFARQNQSASSDVISTASEMGTVIDFGDKLAELENMEREIARMETPPASNKVEELFPMDNAPWDNGLALPVLEEALNDVETQSEEKKGSDRDEEELFRRKPSAAASALLTSAIRRIGSGLGNRGTMSAPSTPGRLSQSPLPQSAVQQWISEATPDQSKTMLLRSPEGANPAFADNEVLTPRFRSNSVDSTGEKRSLQVPSRAHQRAFQIAKSCFSYDAYDTNMDDIFEVSMTDTDTEFSAMVGDKKGFWLKDHVRSGTPLKSSASWDVAGASSQGAFRPRLKPRGLGTPRPLAAEAFRPRSSARSTSSGSESGPHTPNRSNVVESKTQPVSSKKTPQRIEIEREDALDILSVLVNRGVSLKVREGEGRPTKEFVDGEKAVGEESKPDLADNLFADAESTASSSTMLTAIDEIRELLLNTSHNPDISYERRQLALDELQRSHEYALEMRRASQSALTWLKSVDRSNETASQEASRDSVLESRELLVADDIDLVTAKAMLRSTQMQIKEKSDLADRLNEELAKCRAEIGRLRTSSQISSFKSPNRSILDEAEDAVNDEASNEVDRSFDTASTPLVGVNDGGFVETSSYLDDRNLSMASFLDNNRALASEGGLMDHRRALEEANERIALLHGRLKKCGAADDDVPTVPYPKSSPFYAQQSMAPTPEEEDNYESDWGDLSSGLPPPPDHDLRTPIVYAILEQWSSDRSLHGTLLDWIEEILAGRSASAIPPLMISNVDSQVRDGFVMHVLPLLLRRADIQVDVKTRTRRLTSHDLSVAVEPNDNLLSPAIHQRFDTYGEQSLLDTGSVTHSTATSVAGNSFLAKSKPTPPQSITHPENAVSVSRVSYDEMAEDGIGVDQPHGLMSALGGALGGLLSRRQKPLSGITEDVSSPPAVAAAAENFGSGNDRVFLDDGTDQPYHRVVSAPAGRLGATFVQYRGHAMVSDIAPDSPLSGWIFPSDILIAIDELPVSGMRVRDIIKVLMDRKDRQRALRVISSHAMNELSLNTSAVMEATS